VGISSLACKPHQFTLFKAINQTLKVFFFHDPILICSLLALGKVLKDSSACSRTFIRGIIFAQIFIQTVICTLILAGAVGLAVLDPTIIGLIQRIIIKCCDSLSFMCDLHIVVALEEISNLALAEFGVTKFTGRGGTAQNEICTFLRAIRGSLV